jgi:hypothetical protein
MIREETPLGGESPWPLGDPDRASLHERSSGKDPRRSGLNEGVNTSIFSYAVPEPPTDETTLERAAAPGDRRTPMPEESASYEAVRDSWVEEPPITKATEPVRSDPPALPVSIREPPSERSPTDALFADRMLERLAADDYAGALMVAEALLRRRPRDADALDCAEMSRTELRKLYETRLGALDRVPSIAMPRAAIAALTLDVFAGLLLSRVDGAATVQEIAFDCGLAPDHALRVLSELFLHGVIALAP